LETLSDENHPLSAAEIIKLLYKEGITAERKAIYTDIEALRDIGYDIVRKGGNDSGYYLKNRRFKLPEISLLIDAVQSAEFIPSGKSRELVEKLEGLVSNPQAAEIKGRVCIDNRNKCKNEDVYCIIEDLSRAINSQKKVKIVYARSILSDSGVESSKKEMVVSPYALLWDSDHYYLICNNAKYDNLMHLRVDRIEYVKLSKDRSRHFSEVSDYKQRFDTADYARKTFNMFGGEKCRIDLECDMKLLSQVLDRFGGEIFIRRDKEHGVFRFTTDALISDGLVGWIMQFGGEIKVLSPEELKNNVRGKAEQLLIKHKS
jgi:predicted DNA-binding transcriptional regulator YafY